ncbi:MAG: glycosyltransferase family 39 protein [Bacteroidia bacterium]|nr:glycosyltransferase family 39 protein [Bacteroidia bacterium]
MNPPKLNHTVFWIIVLFLHVLGFTQALHSGSIYLVDSIDYLSQAENFKQHSSLYAAPWDQPIKPDYFSFRPPVYGLLIYCIKLLVQTDYAILFLQLLISVSTIWGVLKFAKELGLNQDICRFTLLGVLVFYPSQIIHCNFVMSDILFQSLLFWALYFTYHLWKYIELKYSIWAIVFFALAMLTKPVAYLLGISFAIILVITFLKQKKLLLLVPFLVLPLIYHSYASYNKRITGYYHYSSVTPIFVLKYMAKYTNAQIYGEAYADEAQDSIMKIANAAKTYQERYELMNQAGKEIIAQHPLTFAWFNVKGWLAFMIDPGRFEWVHFMNINEGNYLGLYHVINTQGLVNGLLHFMQNAPILLLLVLFICLVSNSVVSISFLHFLWNKNADWILRLCIFLFVGYIIGSTGVLGLSRYRVAVAPFLWIAVMYTLHSFLLKKNGVTHS